MRVILIEGEHSSLTCLENMLSTIPDMEIVGKYDNPTAGKEKVLSEDVDIVFMDIQLPNSNGIELAAQILKRKPHIGIVFLAAYDHYAVKAFELNALDYLLKPVQFERLQKTLQRIRNRAERKAAQRPQDMRIIRIRMFQQFSMSTESGEIQIRWRTSRAQELFLHLLQHRGKIVRKSTLTELLWPEYPEERAYSQLYTTIYHVRKALQPYAHHLKIMNPSHGKTNDLSGGGLSFLFPEPMEVEQTLSGNLVLKTKAQEKTVSFHGRIVNCIKHQERSYKISIEFLHLKESARAEIIKYCLFKQIELRNKLKNYPI